jgi:predicted nucleic acid-binding protein
MTERVFLDASVVVRYLSEDDPPRALAAARLIDGDRVLVVSENPALGRALIRFLTRQNVEVVDADKAHLVAALERSLATSARRISDAVIAATAEHANCTWIATFDEAFRGPCPYAARAARRRSHPD